MIDVKMKSQNDVEMTSKIFVSTFDETINVQVRHFIIVSKYACPSFSNFVSYFLSSGGCQVSWLQLKKIHLLRVKLYCFKLLLV